MARYLAIDLGTKRTGIAVGDDELRLASPVSVIRAQDRADLLAQIGAAIEDHGPDALVLGLALNMDGTEGPAAKGGRDFAAELERRFQLTVHLVDERLTSEAVEPKLGQQSLTRGQKKARRDALAAATILQDFLNTR